LRMGHLEPGNAKEDLHREAKFNMPLWMAQPLHEERYANVELPQPYGRKFGSAVQAGSKTVLLGRCPYWYEVGIKLASLLPDHMERVTKLLNDAFLERYIDIFT
jgi:hypothetical protein